MHKAMFMICILTFYPHGEIAGNPYPHCIAIPGSDELACICNAGYDLFTEDGQDGHSIPVPKEDGLKDGDTLRLNRTCVRKSCSVPRFDRNNSPNLLTGKTYHYYEDRVNWYCPLHYLLVGDHSSSCEDSGAFTDNMPSCQAQTCPLPPLRPFSRQNFTDIGGEIFKVITIGCSNPRTGMDDPFERHGFCAFDSETSTYSLQGDNLNCPQVDCGPIQMPGLDPSIAGYSTLIESTVAIVCDSTRGFTLTGDRDGLQIAECGNYGRWNLGTMVCQGPRCQDPGTNAGTRQVAENGYEMDQLVYYECLDSTYTLSSSSPLLCVYNDASSRAEWNGTAPMCYDDSPPQFTSCPGPFTLDLYDDVTFAAPTVHDNSGFQIMHQVNGSVYGVANYNKTYSYEVFDRFHSATCVVDIFINDRTAPWITCPTHVFETTDAGGMTLNFTDLISSSHPHLVTFNPPGVTTVAAGESLALRATVTKENGLVEECGFVATATYCGNETLGTVQNGRIEDCFTTGSVYTCSVQCDEGYVLPNKKTATRAVCYTSGQFPSWGREPSFYNCYETTAQIQSLTGRLFYESSSELFAVPETCYEDFLTAMQAVFNAHELDLCGAYRLSMTNMVANDVAAFKVRFDFDLHVDNYDDNTTALQECINELLNGKSTYFYPYVNRPSSVRAACGYNWVNIDDPSESLLADSAACDDRLEEITLAGTRRCVPCLPGYHWDDATSSCSACPPGFYTNNPNQDVCSLQCNFNGGDDGKFDTLYQEGITSQEGCPKFCPNGFTSSTGLIQDGCSPCPVNTKWTDSMSCSDCAEGTGTKGREATSADCINICPAGKYSISGFIPCALCPRGFYQPNEGQKSCMECPAHQSTSLLGSSSESECVDIECRTDCYAEGSTATSVDDCYFDTHESRCSCKPNYRGHRCEIYVDACDPNPCYNGATCVSNGTEFMCECPQIQNCTFVEQPRLDYDKKDVGNLLDVSRTLCEQSCLERDDCKGYIYETTGRRMYCWLYTVLHLISGDDNGHVGNSFAKTCSGEPLFAGEYCEEDLVNDCTADTCTDRDFCHDLVNGADCVCPPGVAYINQRCEKAPNPCSAVTCMNGGECEAFGDVRYHCNCPVGFTGDRCDVNIDDCTETTCLYGGRCEDRDNGFYCHCIDGFSGANCEVLPDVCSNADCKGGGCITEYPNVTAICMCPHNYEWPDSGERDKCVPIKHCDSSPCVNSVRCNNILGGYSCECQDGFNGARCQHNIDDCTPNPCLNHGVCQDGVDDFVCECPPGFEGDICEMNINDCRGECENGAICDDLVMDYKCNCQPGYGGRNCSDILDPCDAAPCHHGGNCTMVGVNTFRCDCPQGWEGDKCQSRVDHCEGACENDAACYSLARRPYCRCNEGTAGDRCDIKSNLCGLFGSFLCKDGSCENTPDGSAHCVCDGEITSCEMKETDRILYDTSNTLGGFVRQTLEQCKDSCINNALCKAVIHTAGFCLSYGQVTMSDEAGAYAYGGIKKCRFDPFYSGKSCQLLKDVCHENPCGVDDDNLGECSVSGLTYSCDCHKVDNYEGNTCQTPKEVCQPSTCPAGVECRPYINKHGKLSPACLCGADEVLAGSICKKINNDFDLMFPMTKEHHSYVSSVQGFVTGDSGEITIAMWVACLEEPENWILSIAESDQDPGSEDYHPLIAIRNDEAMLRYNDSLYESVSLQGELSHEYKWHFVSIGVNRRGEYQVVYDANTYDFDYEDHHRLNFTMPANKYFFIHLGNGFSGYISQVHVWHSVVSMNDLLAILPESLSIPKPSHLLLQWNLFEHDVEITPVRPSHATFDSSVCSVPSTVVAANEHCREESDVVKDKKAPRIVGVCEKSVTLVPRNGSNQVTLDMLDVEFDDGTTVSSNVPIDALSFGAHDVAIVSTDLAGNAGVCMTRVYVTNHECIDTIPAPGKSFDNFQNVMSTCEDDGLYPSVPIPNVFSCGKLRTFNLDHLYSPAYYRIPCGVEDDLYVTLTVNLAYRVGVSCALIDVTSQFRDEITGDLIAIDDSGWNFCEPNCDSIEITVACDVQDSLYMLVHFVIKDLPTTLSNYVDGVHVEKSPEEAIRYLVDTGALNAESISNAFLAEDRLFYNSTFLCLDGFGRMSHACVECAPGTYYMSNPQKCKLCPIGFYSNESRMDSCLPCAEGMTTLQIGSSSNSSDCVPKCPKGEMYNMSSGFCDPCPPSFYQDKEGQGFCKPCPATTGTAGTGSMSRDDCQGFCQPGKELIDRVCVDCEKGFYRIGNLQDRCKKCPTNYTTLAGASTGINNCNVPKCSPGSFVDDSGLMMECKECDYGFYQSEEAQFECDSCDPSYTTVLTGSLNDSFCTFVCGPGEEVHSTDLNRCVPCPRGTYKEDSIEHRFLSCLECPDEMYTTDSTGATNSSQCNIMRCDAGTYYNASSNACFQCPVGSYQHEDQQETCISCGDNYSTVDVGSNSSDHCIFLCPEGYEVDDTGKDCQLCPRGYYKTADMRFESCTMCAVNTTLGTGATSADECIVAICEPGYIVSDDLADCIPCELDSYQPQNAPLASTKCTLCDNNKGTYYTGSNSSSDCLKTCRAGQGLVDGNCVLCSRGTWNNGNSSMRFEECAMCPYNTTTEVLNSATSMDFCNIPLCAAGYIIEDGVCVECDYDSYQTADEPFPSTVCTPCEGSTGTKHTGADSPGDCAKTCLAGYGYNMVSDMCDLCVRGTWNNGNVSMRFEECASCPEGFTTEIELGAVSMDDCDLRDCKPGSFFDRDNADECTECPIGTYQNSPRQSSCIDCPANKNTSTTGASSDDECFVYCLAGTEDDGSGNCIKCEDDYFKNSGSFSECEMCTGDVTSTPGNRARCTETYCDVGRYLKDTSCTDCPLGHYKSERGNSDCLACPGNTTTDSTGAISGDLCTVTYCEAGFYSPDDDTCMACSEGFYKSTRGNDDCTQCIGPWTTAHKGSTDEAACDLPICAPGEFREDKVCEECPIGKYQSTDGATFCDGCDDGFTTLSTGSTSVDDCLIVCPPGEIRNDTTNKCENCGYGYYQAEEGQTQCDPCLGNQTTFIETASSSDQCHVLCPAGYERRERVNCALCPIGKYQTEAGLSQDGGCQLCPAVDGFPATTLNEGSTDAVQCIPQCTQGLYLNMTERQCHDCPVGTYSDTVGLDEMCQDCQPGTTTLSTGSTNSNDCSYSLCQKGSYRKLDEQECQLCDFGSYQPMDETQTTSCTSCDDGETTLVEGATGSEYCLPDCDDGQQYNQDTQACEDCPIGQYRRKDEFKRCYYCESGKTTLSKGSSTCVATDVTPSPVVSFNFVTTMSFRADSCENPSHLQGQIRNIIRSIFMALAGRYRGLCNNRDCGNLVIVFGSTCGPVARKRSTSGDINTEMQMANVDSRLTDTDTNREVDPETVIQDGLRDMVSQRAALEESGLTPQTNIDVTVTCNRGSLLQDDQRTCQPCPVGKYHDADSDTCVAAPRGNYTDTEGSSTYKSCPEGMTTSGTGSSSADDCDGLCLFDDTYCVRGTCESQADGKSSCDCDSYYEGVKCDQYVEPDRGSDDTEYLIAGIAGGLGSLLFIILIIVGCVTYNHRSRRSSKRHSDTDSDSLRDYKSASVVPYNPPYHMNPLFTSGPTQPVFVQDPTMYHTNQLDYYHPIYHNHHQETNG